MQEFPGNSQKARTRSEAPPIEERPKIKRVTTVDAERKKRGLGRKFKDTFVIGSTRDAADYMIVDVIVPAIKDTIIDALQGGVERLFNGESPRTRRSLRSSAYSNVPRVDYQSQYKSPTAPPAQRTLSRRSRALQDFGEIIIESRTEANEVIEQLFEILSRFGMVHVADLYEMTGVQSSHVDHKWGWTSLRGAKAVRMRDGRFLIDLPEPSLLS